MALEHCPSAQQDVCGMKRRHTDAESPMMDPTTTTTHNISSIVSSIDWVDHVVADVSSNDHVKVSRKSTNVKERVKVEPPLQEFFTKMLQSRGYPGSTHSTLTCGYNNKPTQHQISSYGVAFLGAIRTSNLQQIKMFLFESGLNPNACNRFGESVVHLVCRRRNHAILQILLEAGCSVQVCDDFGRTPLHDACWTSHPNFQLISMLLDQDQWLLCLKDSRGTTPLGYVKYESHCRLWIEYLKKVADKYWPCLQDESGDASPDESRKVTTLQGSPDMCSKTPPLVSLKPNSRPIPDTKSSTSLEVIEQVANGLPPQDADITHRKDLKKCQGEKRSGIITCYP